ncbi:Bcr/CflA subfamily drug resistance transporter [Cereibacter sphaeroides WS8N]|uniref:multidrug effflux MFS transporter n=1 Tax=Cereibacter sphaeroides TaxID=1063 RepID=UPI00020DF6BB|nr:multidrug effflux MFS transporter [Cereibacter sphaeroides]EGJ20646.1 Bcr/CflA subfamily drug resistance transporter [Cereibacter sphaeroides WS8N]
MIALPPPRFLDRRSPPHILTLVMLTGLAALAMNIFLPSLPGMSAWFDAPYQLLQLSVALYLGLSALLQVAVGPISDRFGRRNVILWSLGLFLAATVGTLLAPTAEVFLVFRMAQAVIAAGMVLSRAVVRDMVPDEQAASMIGYVTMGMSLVPMIGPVIGGMLDEAFGWQANFTLLLVLGLLVTALVWADLGETSEIRPVSFGAQLRQYPALLGSQRFWGYVLCAAFASGCFFAYLGGAPFVGTEIFHLSSSQVGLYFSAPAIGYALGNFLSGRFSIRMGMNRMVLWGTVATTLGLAILMAGTLAGLHHPLFFFGMMTAVGLGNGMVLPNANAGMLSIHPQLAGTASGLGGAIMIGGGAALAALAGVVLTVEGGEMPLILIMLFSGVASVVSILWVMRRARALGLAP